MKILNPIAKIKDKENTLGLNIEKKPLTKKKMTNQSKKRLSENALFSLMLRMFLFISFISSKLNH